MNSPTVVHLTSVHTAKDVRILEKECTTLAAAGFDVVLVTPADRTESLGRVRHRAVKKPRGRRERILATTKQILRVALAEDAALYHFHDSELIPVGIALKLLGKKVLYDVHENLPKSILDKEWVPSKLRMPVAMLADLVEKLTAIWFDGVIAATPAIGRRFPHRKTTVIQNFPKWEPAFKSNEAHPASPPFVVYVGGLTAIRGIKQIVKAVGLVADPTARLLLVGEFDSPEFAREVQAMPEWKRVDFLGWQPREKVNQLLKGASAGLVLFLPAGNHIEAQPNKLFEYMAAGIPVVASDFPLWRQIVEGAGCGLVTDSTDPRGIAGAIDWLLENPAKAQAMGRKGQVAVMNKYHWGTQAQRLLEVYGRLLGYSCPVVSSEIKYR